MQKSIQGKMFKGIQRWQQSGLTQKAWCEKHGIAYGTFHYWYKQYRDQASVTEQSGREGFVQLTMHDATHTSGWCELEMPNGKKLVFHQPVPAGFIKGLLD